MAGRSGHVEVPDGGAIVSIARKRTKVAALRQGALMKRELSRPIFFWSNSFLIKMRKFYQFIKEPEGNGTKSSSENM